MAADGRRIARVAAVAVVAALLCAGTAFAADDDETGGLAASALTIRVGYFGGPYYEKAAFTADELWRMNVLRLDYTFIDNMPSVVIEHAACVPLADIMAEAGIDLSSVQSFNFWTNDKRGGYYTSLTKRFLIDTPRYCYYSLPDNFDYDMGAGNAYATGDAVWVPSAVALADDWNRVIAGASFGSDYMNLRTDTRFRLLYGQTDAKTRTASDSAKWIHAIEVTFGGAPTLTMDASVLDLKVGSEFRAQARIRAADPVIAANVALEWESSDPAVASVDAEGRVTVHAEGDAVITARLGEASASVRVASGGSGESGAGLAGESGGAADARSGVAPSGLTASDAPRAARELRLVGARTDVGDAGGVQNGRTGDMASDAVALPSVTEEANPLRGFALAAAALCLIGGGVAEYLYFVAAAGGGRREKKTSEVIHADG